MLTLNSSPILSASVLMPRVGVWTADLEVDTDTAPTGTVVLSSDAGPSWRGTVISGAVTLGTWRGRLVGGAGGLRRNVGPLAYQNPTLGDVLADALREAGETLSAASGSLAQSTTALWHRIAGPAAQTVRDVARAQGWPWRVLDDGSVWMGPETWDAAEAAELEVLAPDPIEERYAVSGDVFGLRPGTTVLLRGPEGDVGVQVDTVLLRVALAQATATVWGFRG